MRRTTIIGLVLVAAVATGACASENGKAAIDKPKHKAPTTTEAPVTTEAPTTTEPQPKGPATVKLGFRAPEYRTEDGQRSNYAVTVANLRTGTKTPEEFGYDADNGLFVVVDVTVEVDGKAPKAVTVDPSSFKLIAPDGTAYDETYASGWGKGLDYIDLAAGQRTSGTLVFDVKPGHEHGVIQQSDGGLDPAPLVNWQL